MAKCMQCGGAKKMAKGGSAGIVGMPKYGNNPRTQEGRMLKKGGSVKKYAAGGATKTTAVKQGCPPGKVRLANGGCGDRPRYGG